MSRFVDPKYLVLRSDSPGATNSPRAVEWLIVDTAQSRTYRAVMPANETKEKILREIEKQRMAYSFKMLLLVFMAELADPEGRVPLNLLADRFGGFFNQRARQNKQIENPKGPGDFANRTSEDWEKVIIRDPAPRLGRSLLRSDGSYIRWAPEVWNLWTQNSNEK